MAFPKGSIIKKAAISIVAIAALIGRAALAADIGPPPALPPPVGMELYRLLHRRQCGRRVGKFDIQLDEY